MPSPATMTDVEQWRAVRKVVLERDGGACRACGVICNRGDADIHHLIPRSAGGDDDPANLVTLCDGCHAAHHPNLQGSLARRTIERWAFGLARFLDRGGELAGLDETVCAAMRLFGVARLRPHQLEVVLAALRGESLLLVSATGSGKTLCFQLPILLRRGCGFVLSPLKALMSEQVAQLTRLKIPGTFINGDLGPDEKAIRYTLLQHGAVKFLYCTPERFDVQRVRGAEVEALLRVPPSFLVVDEAHCIDRWGRDFRPAYGRLGALREQLGRPPVLAFTATAGVRGQRRILDSLGIPNARVIVTGVDRPNIKIARLRLTEDRERFALIALLLQEVRNGRAMIFVPTVKSGLLVQEGLGKLGVTVPFYHAKLGTANERDLLLGRFTGRLEPPAPVVICTNAFGMGLDVPDVRLVVHWLHPASVEDYHQEIGRAGRDGKPSVALLLTRDDDTRLLDFMARKTAEAVQSDAAGQAEVLATKQEAIRDMESLATASQRCMRTALSEYFGDASAGRKAGASRRIVEWLILRTRQTTSTDRCCDKCDAVTAFTLLPWAREILRPRS